MATPLEMQRTFAIIGTGGCGKTSLAEMLMFNTGTIDRLGRIEEGNTALDYEPEEVRRHGSIQPAFATWLYNKNRHFMIDIPGDGNFTGDMDFLLKGVDGVIFVIDAIDGVRPLTKKFWNLVKEEKLPAIVVVNKMDRDRANFQMAADGLSTLGAHTAILQLPICNDGEFTGFIDIIEHKCWQFGDDGKITAADIPADLEEDVDLIHDVTIENIAESDEKLMEKYLDEGSLPIEDLKNGLRSGVINGTITPILACSALHNKGGREILEAISSLLPSPLERPAFNDAAGNARTSSPEKPLACFVVKTLADPFAGQLSILRILSGTLKGDVMLKNMSSNEQERIGSLLFLKRGLL